MTTNYAITSQEQIWDIFSKLSTNQLDVENLKISFESFPRISIKFEGANFHASLPTRCMDALKTIQNEIYRLYSLAVYNDENYVLTKEEKDSVELFFKVEEGSSDTEPVNFREVLNKIIDKAAEKMEPKHYIIIVSIVVVGWIAKDTLSKALELEANKDIASITANAIVQNNIAQTSQETQRLHILKDIIVQNPNAKKAAEIQDRSSEAVAKSVKGAEKVIMPDKTIITESVAKELYPKSKRRKSEEIRMDGTYMVKTFDRSGDDIKVKIEDEFGKEFNANTNFIDQSLLDKISLACSQQKKIRLSINAKNFEGERKEIVIINAEEINSLAGAPDS